MKTRHFTIVLAALLAAVVQAQQDRRPTFRSTRDLVSVDVVVRDRAGNVVRDLKPEDFEVREDGRPQDVLSLSFQEIAADKVQPMPTAELLAGVEERLAASASNAPPPAPVPMTSADVSGRRLMVLLFDLSSMQPEDVQRAIDSANTFVSDSMSGADLVAVATVSSALDVLTDFTGDRTTVAAALTQLAYTEGTATPPPDASTAATD